MIVHHYSVCRIPFASVLMRPAAWVTNLNSAKKFESRCLKLAFYCCRLAVWA